MQLAVSLEDIRRNRYETVAEFAKAIQVSPSTYYRALEGRVELPTMRHIAAALHVAPASIAEFAPPASPALLQELTAGVDAALADGWLEVDPETLEPTGRRVFEPFPDGDA
jgi:transcriptional regulator with XRE-family HTH domain